ncbi:MAG TPA: hypothetical protein VD866_08760 [Urbifossiella sp.]|nr:hypothetical protein [Urbifossiella sp.]
MTTPAKAEANRRNARKSTGPRTPAGKLVVARNAVTHGVFAHIAVVPGENPYDWDQHRAGILASLAPVGLLEVTLAERVALLLWQMARLGRYQAAALTAAVEDAGLPVTDDELLAAAFHPPGAKDDDHLKVTAQNLRMARTNHVEVLAAADLLRGLGDAGPGSVRGDLAVAVLGWADDTTRDYPFRRSWPLYSTEPEFLARLGVAGEPRVVTWTADQVRAGLDYYAGVAGEALAVFRGNVLAAIDGRVAALERLVRRLEAEEPALVRRAEGGRARAADAALLPPEGVADRVMKYEKHLHGLVMSTLHELERLKSRRAGRFVPPPMVADLNVTVTGG